MLYSCYEPVSFVFVLVTFPSGATLQALHRKSMLYFVQDENPSGMCALNGRRVLVHSLVTWQPQTQGSGKTRFQEFLDSLHSEKCFYLLQLKA